MATPDTVILLPKRTRPCTHDGARVSCENCSVRLNSVCAALDDNEIAALERIAQPVCFAAKETLFLEGEDAEAAYTVTRGAILLYRIFDDGRRQVVGFQLPGDFIAIDADKHHGYSADAITPVTLCRFPRKEFTALLAKKPNLLQRLYDTAEKELSEARDHLMALGQRSAREKLAWFLVHLRRRSARLDAASDTVALPMSRQEIADYLGLTIETVSRTLTALARDKVIAIVPNGVKVTDVKKIERLAAA